MHLCPEHLTPAPVDVLPLEVAPLCQPVGINAPKQIENFLAAGP